MGNNLPKQRTEYPFSIYFSLNTAVVLFWKTNQSRVPQLDLLIKGHT